MNKSNQIKPLTARYRIGYALGDFGGCMTFGLMTAFTTRYYINVALIDTAVISVMTLIWKLFDALANPFVGVMLDRSFAASGGKRDKFRPWILRMAPMLSVCAILVFTAPGWVDGMGRIVVAFTTYLMYEAVYAIHVIAFAGLISGMAVNDDERSKLSAARGIGGSLGTYMYADLLGRLSLMSTAAILSMPVTILFMSFAPKFSGKFGSERLLRGSLLFPALCALGSWLVFRFVWNITPELREKMAMARQA